MDFCFPMVVNIATPTADSARRLLRLIAQEPSRSQEYWGAEISEKRHNMKFQEACSNPP